MKNKALISARKEKGLTQKQLADKLGLQKTTVSNWENGYSRPNLDRAFKAAEILSKDAMDIFFDEKVQESHTKIV